MQGILPAGMRVIWVVVLMLAGFAAVEKARGQATPPPPPPAQDQTAPDAGGPAGDSGVIALPKKKEAPADIPPPAPDVPKVKNPEGLPPVSLHLDTTEVTVDVGVLLEKTHQFVPGLKPNNFRIYEDGVAQKVTGFKRTEAPITALVICEFAATNYTMIYDMRNAAMAFTQQLRPQDYVALMTFDMRTQIVSDFTQDKRQFQEAIMSLRIPGFSETNVFDALYEGIDRLERIEGRKYIILIASGRDSFSKLTLDKILKKVKESRDITIYTISTGGAMRAMTEGRMGMRNQMRDIDFLQADNEMKTFASMTGGASYFPRFQGEYPDIFNEINRNIRSKYELVYHPTNTKLDGTYRKLRVELVDDEGQPLHIQDEKHKPLKYDIIARDGYRARQQVE
jgi:VWFA-related protein